MPQITDFVDNLYNSILEAGIHKAPSIKVAEAAKLVKNTQRYVNILLMNEFSQFFDFLGLDIKEILSAAETKWNFQPYYGGPCLESASAYLAFTAQEQGFDAKIIHFSHQINDELIPFVINKLKKTKKNGSLTEIVGINISFTKPSCKSMKNEKVISI